MKIVDNSISFLTFFGRRKGFRRKESGIAECLSFPLSDGQIRKTGRYESLPTFVGIKPTTHRLSGTGSGVTVSRRFTHSDHELRGALPPVAPSLASALK
jgi:hypothetical protein